MVRDLFVKPILVCRLMLSVWKTKNWFIRWEKTCKLRLNLYLKFKKIGVGSTFSLSVYDLKIFPSTPLHFDLSIYIDVMGYASFLSIFYQASIFTGNDFDDFLHEQQNSEKYFPVYRKIPLKSKFHFACIKRTSLHISVIRVLTNNKNITVENKWGNNHNLMGQDTNNQIIFYLNIFE